jgi:hypothetical protein
VGAEIDGSDLDITVVKVRPGGTEVLGAWRIEKFDQRPAAEWGAEYEKFLQTLGVAHLAATVLLPRNDVIVRHLPMPGVSDRDLEQAVTFQIDGLHPYSDEDAVQSWARLDGSGNVLVGITRRQVLDRYTALFAEAGVKIASFTFSAAILYASLRLISSPPAGGFLAMTETPDSVEAYGESGARPVFSASFDPRDPYMSKRSRDFSLSELRLPAETEALPLEELVPKPRRAPEEFNLHRRILPYATGMVSACPRLGLQVNLLPAAMRSTSSRMVFVPSIVLGSLLLIGAGTLAGYTHYGDKQYLEKLQAEIARLEPEARKPLAMDQAINQARARTIILDQFRKRTKADLDVLQELTKILEPPAWVNGLEVTRDTVRMSGEAQQAAGLLRLIDQSPLFEASEFSAPMSRSATGEVFAIRARREAQR